MSRFSVSAVILKADLYLQSVNELMCLMNLKIQTRLRKVKKCLREKKSEKAGVVSSSYSIFRN